MMLLRILLQQAAVLGLVQQHCMAERKAGDGECVVDFCRHKGDTANSSMSC